MFSKENGYTNYYLIVPDMKFPVAFVNRILLIRAKASSFAVIILNRLRYEFIKKQSYVDRPTGIAA